MPAAASFSEVEVMVIEKEITRKSYEDIAFLIDRSVDELRAFLEEFLQGREILTFQAKVDARRKPAAAAKVRAPRVKKEKVKKEKKKKEAKIISRVIEHTQKENRSRRNQPKFHTKAVDYSQMTTVRIDNRTTIYAKPGEDPEEVRQRYLKNYKSLFRNSIQE